MRPVNKGFKARMELGLAATLGVLALSLGANATALADAAPVKAVWQVKEIYFPYFGLTTRYSCDGLRDKVQAILKQLGARADALVSVGGCESIGPANSPSVRIIVANPMPASDVADRGADPKRAQLLAKLRKGKTIATEEPFDAVPTRVSLFAKDHANDSAAGDCELLEQMRDRVIKPLGGNVVKNDLRCTPYQGSIGNQSMVVDILVPVQKG